ncbi:DUF3265 domain-containing protein [Vibrio vulnificus]|nr:DUF3265 domain-containing protein [Vibrio vulnificus]ELP6807175.1 DUF3265 domain-containing protein [Vibrio vulnificus]
MFLVKRKPLRLKHNKAFKRDSCRVAFLVCGGFGGESGLRKVGLGGIHPLTRRYANIQISPFLNAYVLGCRCK